MNDIKCIEKFNKQLLGLLSYIKSINSSSKILVYGKIIESTIKSKADKDKLIQQFVVSILKYKKEIDNGNEDFFLGKSFIDNKIKDSSKETIQDAFQFKNIWKKLDQNKKKFIVSYMQLLCFYAKEYGEKYGNTEIKKMCAQLG